MSDTHLVIINYTRQMIGREAVGLQDDHVVLFRGRKGFGSSVNEIGEGQGSRRALGAKTKEGDPLLASLASCQVQRSETGPP